MRAFLIQHIDSLVIMGVAIFWVVYASRRFSMARNWFLRKPHVLGLILLFCGALLFFSESSANYSWRRLATSDGKASAEFPEPAITETEIDASEGSPVKRFTTKSEVPHRDIKLRLTWSEVPSAILVLTAAQRMEVLKATLEEQGFVFSSCLAENRGSVACYRIVADKDGGNLRLRMRVAFTLKSTYRAIAVSSSGFHDDPAIQRFIDSFSIE